MDRTAFRSLPLVAMLACNQIAGIADLRTGDLAAAGTDAGTVDVSAVDGSAVVDAGPLDAANGGDDGPAAVDPGDSGATDAAGASDGAPVPPACPGTQVGLVIEVRDSRPGTYTSVSEANGLFQPIGVGDSFERCVDRGTALELRADPDLSIGVHDWGTPLCASGRRCSLTIQAPTALVIDLL